MKTDVNFKANLSQNLYFIRGLAIVLVVVGHVIGYNKQYGMRQLYNSDLSGLGWLCDFINTFHMPVFFIASGVAFAVFSKKDISYRKFLRSKFEKLFIPLICWAPSYFVFQSLSKGKSFSFFDVIEAIVYPYEIFWFIHALIFATFLSFICFKVFKSKLIYFFISSILFVLCLRIDIMYVYWHWNIFYVFGVLIAPYLSVINLNLKKQPIFINFIILFLSVMAMITTKYFIPFHDALDLSRLINGVIAFLFMYIMLNLGKTLPLTESLDKLLQSVKNHLVYLGESSMIIYLFHGYFTRSTILLLLNIFGLPNQALYFILVSTMGALGPILLYIILLNKRKILMYSIGGGKG
jgi:fucose 4-O-acetylase-like acetyltransferase